MSNYLVSDTDLGAIADAIRAKSGGSGQLAFPAGFVSEIGDIPSDTPIYGLASLTAWSSGVSGKTELIAKLPDLAHLTLPDTSTVTLTKIDIQCGTNSVELISGCSSTKNGGALKTVDLHGARAYLPSSGTGLRYRTNLETINAKVRVYTTNTNNQFTGATKLKTIFFQENAQDISVNISACPLSNESLVSLANGLKLGATSSTLALSSSRKSTAQSMLGTVSTVGSGADAYEIFTPDENGDTTLAQFITINKGWTLS